jgi:beta-lactamase regulating signal transducer with metallopeptidase domain
METAAMHLFSEISRHAAEAFVSGLWQGLVLVAAVALCLRAIPRISAATRFVVWGVTFALASLLPLLHSEASASSSVTGTAPVLRLSAVWGLAIAAAWIVLSVFRLAQLAAGALRLRRIWRRATPIFVAQDLRCTLKAGGISATLCVSGDVDVPSVIGFFAPRLLIPESLFARLSDIELRQIVLHECEHLRRRDDWINLLQKIGLALFPLNPALFWVDRRLGLERELACDAGVVAATSAPFDYAHCLTRLAEHRLSRHSVALALSAWSRQPELVRRVHTLLRPMRALSPRQARAAVAALSLAVAGSAFEMARAPRFIAFSDGIAAPVQQASVDANAIQAVAYRSASPQPHVTLAKAIMPASNAVPTRWRTAAIAKSAPKAALDTARFTGARDEPALRHPRMILTTATQHDSFSPGEAPAARTTMMPVYAVTVTRSVSYAAVPFGDGWLIFQL